MELPNGCSVNKLIISPSNWNSEKANVNEIWQIDFYLKLQATASTHPLSKQVRLKEGINRVKLLSDK